MPRKPKHMDLDTIRAQARKIAADSATSYDETHDDQEHALVFSSVWRAMRIDIPNQSVVGYRQCLKDIINEAQRQLASTEPRLVKGMQPGIILMGCAMQWRNLCRAWKRRGGN